ncbi:MAG: class I SAM-dependent methyltransferase [Candidatus Atribacteria bacterium]
MKSDNLKKIQVKPEHYYSMHYDDKSRFCSYWHQINEIVSVKPTNILEIGIGNGFLCSYLRQRGFKVTTLDIDEKLCPDVVSSVLSMPFDAESFDLVACYEVLEHIPFDHFHKVLEEIRRVTKKYAILSLPDCARVYRLNIQIPKIGELKKLIPLPRLKPIPHEFDSQHYWLINKAGYSLKKIILQIENADFQIMKTYRVFEHPYHRFFVLIKV